jgi:acetyl esterase/lipase
MDIHIPPNSALSDVPVVILIHGGGWYEGDKSNFDGLGIYDTLLNRKYAVVNMNYRLAPMYKYPAPLDDIDSVIAYLQKNSKELAINAQRICLFGRSAGGHLALQYAYTRNKNNNIKAVIDFFGITDLTDSQSLAARLDTQIASFIGIAYTSGESLWKDASPIYHLNDAIPTIIFHGSIDETVYPMQSQRLKDSLDKRNVACELVMWNGIGHGFEVSAWQASMGMTVGWLNSYMF